MAKNETWIDSIVEAFQALGGDSDYDSLYNTVRIIRENKGLSVTNKYKNTIRRAIQEYSSDSDSFKHRANIFVSVGGKGSGHWGLREEYKNINTFSSKPLEKIEKAEIANFQSINFDSDIDNISFGEDGKQLSSLNEIKIKKQHYIYEGRLNSRQIRIIKSLKGYKCEACGMSFAEKYPEIGNNFIECHHKIPYSEMREGDKRNIDISEFIVLCSNCHSMIHRLDNPSDLEKLKEIINSGSV